MSTTNRFSRPSLRSTSNLSSRSPTTSKTDVSTHSAATTSPTTGRINRTVHKTTTKFTPQANSSNRPSTSRDTPNSANAVPSPKPARRTSSSKTVSFAEFDFMDDLPSWQAEVWDWPLQRTDGMANLTNTDEKFEVALEMATFTPKEIEVKVCGTDLVIHCHHDERSNGQGFMSRQLFRSYHLPEDIDLTTLRSHLTSRGILVITAAKQ